MAQYSPHMRQAIADHLDSHHVSRVTYGAIIGLALIVALQRHPPAVGAVIGSLLGTALAVAFAELYADVLGTETRTRHRLNRHEIAEIAGDVGGVAVGIAFPVAFFLVAALGWIDLDTAFNLAKWTGLGLIAFYGYCAARLAGRGVLGGIVHAVSIATVGLVLILLKALLH
jgi:hypothetical protein